jgi:hypothetical protein
MFFRETWVDEGPFTAYRIPDIAYTDDLGRHQKQMRCVSTFFHRSSRDGIKYNVTNLRRLLECDDKFFLKELEIRAEYGDPPLYKIVECADIDDFFRMIGFDYKAKLWINDGEWSMRAKHTKQADGSSTFKFVDPPYILKRLSEARRP